MFAYDDQIKTNLKTQNKTLLLPTSTMLCWPPQRPGVLCLTTEDSLGEVDRRALVSAVAVQVQHRQQLPADSRGRLPEIMWTNITVFLHKNYNNSILWHHEYKQH